MEDPGYPDARNIFASHTRHLLPLPVDAQGLITGTQLLGCDYLFVTPGHQCPTSVTLSPERRDSLLALASQADSMIIEDDFESESRWGAEPVPALKSLTAKAASSTWAAWPSPSRRACASATSSPRPSWRSSCARCAG